MKNKIITLTLVISLLSCSKFLDEPPLKSSNAPIKTLDDLDKNYKWNFSLF